MKEKFGLERKKIRGVTLTQISINCIIDVTQINDTRFLGGCIPARPRMTSSSAKTKPRSLVSSLWSPMRRGERSPASLPASISAHDTSF